MEMNPNSPESLFPPSPTHARTPAGVSLIPYSITDDGKKNFAGGWNSRPLRLPEAPCILIGTPETDRVMKTETMPKYHASDVDVGLLMKLVASSPVKRQIALESYMGNSSDACYSYNQDQRSNLNMDNLVNGKASAGSHSLPRSLGHELGARSNFSIDPTSYFTSGDKLNITDAQYENALFSSSLSDLFCRQLRLSSNNSSNDHSVAAASLYEVYDPFESLEEVEAQTIGNLLPGDDDLLPGVTDGVEYMAQPHNGDDIEDFDVFSSVGGMDMEDDGLNFGRSNSNISGGNCTGNVGSLDGSGLPFGEHPSRTIFVRNINSSIEDYELRCHFEKFGDIRTLYTACKHRGFIMISYYDIRAAMNAKKTLQNEPLMQQKLDISFAIPKDNLSGKHVNHGTVVVFNLDSSDSNDELRNFFGVYGEINEIRETPLRSHLKFIEFYDVRAAEAALCAMNRSGIAGKQLKVEACCCFGGARGFVQPNSSELDQDDFSLTFKQTSPSSSDPSGFSGRFSQGVLASSIGNGKFCGFHPASEDSGSVQRSFNHVISSSVPKSFPSLIRMGSVGHQSGISGTGCLQNEMKFDLPSVPSFHPHSLSDFHGRLGTEISCGSRSQISPAGLPSGIIKNQQFLRVSSSGASVELNEGVFPPPGKGSCSPAGHHYMRSSMQHPQPQGLIRPNSPSFVNDFSTHPKQMHTVPRAPNDMLNAVLPMSRQHVGSASPVNSSLWDRQQYAYSGESPDASVFNPCSHGNIRISGNSTHPLEFVPDNIFPYMHLKVPVENIQCGLHHQRCMMFPAGDQLNPVLNDFGSPTERIRNHKSESPSNQADNKKQFELDIDSIVRGDDKRTTLMIKNIPNKYTSKTLLAAIDEHHRGTYDFIYLPIDFKNNCNMGYAFINMINPSFIIPFYQAFNGKKWEKFNSKKVAVLAYARIQGKASLIAHFQHSSLMNEDKRCRPILFHTNGPNACDQVPFPMRVNVRPRWVRSRASTG